MPRLDLDLVMHHLSLPLEGKPIKQKFRKMHPHVALLVKVEWQKLLNIGFIRVVYYDELISNLVPFSKLDGSIYICTDFIDLNRACLKDYFTLPNIVMIMEFTIGYEMSSLVDGFSGYN